MKKYTQIYNQIYTPQKWLDKHVNYDSAKELVRSIWRNKLMNKTNKKW